MQNFLRALSGHLNLGFHLLVRCCRWSARGEYYWCFRCVSSFHWFRSRTWFRVCSLVVFSFVSFVPYCISSAGVSRSATIVLSYLIARFPLSYPTIDKCITFVREARPFIAPNTGFRRYRELYLREGYSSLTGNWQYGMRMGWKYPRITSIWYVWKRLLKRFCITRRMSVIRSIESKERRFKKSRPVGWRAQICVFFEWKKAKTLR